MVALSDVVGMSGDTMHAWADASVMRIILMANTIADRPYSTESSSNPPFAFTAEKVRLEEAILTQTSQIRIIGNISCSAGVGGANTSDATSSLTLHSN